MFHVLVFSALSKPKPSHQLDKTYKPWYLRSNLTEYLCTTRLYCTLITDCCCWPGDTRSKGIISRSIDVVGIFRLSTRRLTFSIQEIETGVPHGSLLGRVLFNACKHDIEVCTNLEFIFYVDDTKLSRCSLWSFTHGRATIIKHGLTITPALISNHIHSKVFDEITYPFPNFTGLWSFWTDKRFRLML